MALSRRSLLRVTAVTAAAGGAGAACGPVAFKGVLEVLLQTSVVAFGTAAGTGAAQQAPAFFQQAVDQARKFFDGDRGQVLGGYVPTEVPNTALRSMVGALFRSWNDDEDLRAMTVHDVNGRQTLAIPAVLQLGLNLLVLREAGFQGPNLLEPGQFTSPALAGIRPKYSIYTHSKLEGDDEQYLTRPNVYQAVTVGDETVRVEWDPSSEDPTTHSRLRVQRGRVVKGLAPVWAADEVVPVPYRYVFKGRDPRR